MNRLPHALTLQLALLCGLASAQVHTAEQGAHTLRANAIYSEQLPAASALRHGIEQAADRGVLNVVVLERRDGRQAAVPARVQASKLNLLGQSEPIELRAIEEDGRVSYLGLFEFGPMRNLRFSISATPLGSSETLTVKFEDRFVVRTR